MKNVFNSKSDGIVDVKPTKRMAFEAVDEVVEDFIWGEISASKAMKVIVKIVREQKMVDEKSAADAR